ncbi:N-acetylmuramoyl-L-alanine amidase [Tenacibaculum agarivorans]|uniref:N-acetylmuramoyl-L-alanine amidase n=1 Tax=Tenacibaculum agarivorans TaxID=1908389 RepID=UPI00094BB224|nr:N-acetylmuramoyl-L-alanine amidase [Tenacibaculum agarivorans]
MQFLKFRKYNIKTTTLIFLAFSVFSFSMLNAQKKYTVVLDAGHGGKDPGNLGNGYKESKIALQVVLLIGKALKENNKDIKVIYTRDKDIFVELHNRAKIANDSKADLFVSIHCDSYRSAKAFGAGTFVLGLSGNKQNLEIAKRENAVILMEDNYKQNYDYNPNSPESVISLSMLQEENLDASLAFAGLVQNNFSAVKRYDRSVKQNNFLVLRETVMPSVLIELGFLTNKAEGKFLHSKAGQLKMAKAISKAIEKYISRLKLNTVEGQNKGVSKEKSTNTSAGIGTTTKRDKVNTKTSVKKSPKKITSEIEKDTEKVKIVVSAKKNKPKTVAKEPVKQAVQTNEVKKVTTNLDKSKKEEKKIVAETPKKVTKKEDPKKDVSITQNKNTTSTEKEKTEPSVIEFKVQIAASKEYLTDGNFNFRGLEDVQIIVIDEYFKYFYGNTEDYGVAKENLKVAKEAGHEGCFIVAFENGQKIPLYKALKRK